MQTRQTGCLLLCAALYSTACGTKDGDSAPEPFTFDNLSDEEKLAYMASDVLPTMQSIFQAYDSEAYADFSCGTCHVTGLADGTYAMPDAGLPPLREADFPYEDEVGLFMENEVRATMAELLGPTEGGRPCVTCHTLEE
jgi:hypothetical protein